MISSHVTPTDQMQMICRIPIFPDEDILLLIGFDVRHAFWTFEETCVKLLW